RFAKTGKCLTPVGETSSDWADGPSVDDPTDELAAKPRGVVSLGGDTAFDVEELKWCKRPHGKTLKLSTLVLHLPILTSFAASSPCPLVLLHRDLMHAPPPVHHASHPPRSSCPYASYPLDMCQSGRTPSLPPTSRSATIFGQSTSDLPGFDPHARAALASHRDHVFL
ncbi:hypothetical protein CRG98_040470, partial [Punica granatum]